MSFYQNNIPKGDAFCSPFNFMKIKIKRIDNALPLPNYQTLGAVAFDLYSREDKIIKSKQIELLPSNLIIQAPPGYFLLIASRSSGPIKTGLMFPHGIGIIDQDFCGPEDEIRIQVYNFTDKNVEVKRGERVAQAVFVKIEKAEWEEVDQIEKNTRGGFGSTG